MRKADKLPPYCAVVKNSRSLNFLDPSGPARPVTGVLIVTDTVKHIQLISVSYLRAKPDVGPFGPQQRTAAQ